ncbi:snRNA-activating protein complex subunit 2 [Sarcophilus harrisii]|uniref:Small nuclear RNA activating complex polypeptide 2 n=1 Tax=Sarcophilus harrisii TaxID=9305 RepID=A0A7N4PMU5_SARHA|nr:snRNA-activating protein complex subunit 2 [Sarcophilus harrisii]
MKPPVRRRAAPARYRGLAPTGVRTATLWTAREKQQLLRLLQAQDVEREPAAADLRQGLPHRSEAEIQDFLQSLKRRVAREVIQQEHHCCQKEQRCPKAEIPAPIEVWTDLAKKVTSQLEEAMTTAFSQILTIAATEPVSLLHSIPKKLTQASERQLLCQESHSQGEAPPQAPEPTQETSGGDSGPSGTPDKTDSSKSGPAAPTNGNLVIDFEKIYKYLSSISRSGKALELSPGESAVLLDLLMSLPEELSRLPCEKLQAHMAGSYRKLMRPQQPSDPSHGDPGKGPSVPDGEGGTSGSRDPGSLESPPAESPAASGPSPPSAQHQLWQDLEFCPLNPFLLPLELLSHRAAPGQ